MTEIRLAANFINFGWNLAGWGHLQIVNSLTNEEIEAQTWSNAPPGDAANFPFLQYVEDRDHSANTDFAPGSGNSDPSQYDSIALDIGNRDSDKFWQLLVSINNWFRETEPQFQ